jgi:hypothetical protein
MTEQQIGELVLQLRWAVPEDRREGFEAWYDQEHLADMVAVPGILGGRRFVRVDNRFSSPTPFNFLTLYQLLDASPLTDPAYEKLSTDPSPWTLEVAVGLDLSRTIYRQIRPQVPAGAGPRVEPVGPAVFHVMMAVTSEVEDLFTRWYDEEHFPAMTAVPGVLSARRFVTVRDDAAFGVHREQADHAYGAIYELESADVVATPEFLAAGRRTERREQLGDRIRAHVQTWAQVYPEHGALEAGR